MHYKKDDRQDHEFMNATAPSVLPLLTQDCLRWCIWTCAPKTGEDNPAGLLESVMREKRRDLQYQAAIDKYRQYDYEDSGPRVQKGREKGVFNVYN